jgi:choline-sulfatase
VGFLYYQEHLEHTEQLPEGFTLRHLIARYYGMTSWVDDQVGRLMKGLGDNGLAEDTIVVFLSDHGDNLGSHGLFNKGRLIEESIRISMIWWGPERLQPQVRHGEVASLIDVMPTVLELAGGNTPASVQGQSLVPAGRRPDHAIIETMRGEIGLRTPGHLYGLQLDDERREKTAAGGCLCDLEQTPTR